MIKQRLIAMLALGASFFALCVIGLGAFTRLIDAGLGCPDWPGCFGHWIVSGEDSLAQTPFVAYKAWAEMVHRYFAGTLSTFILVLVILLIINSIKQFKNQKGNLLLAIGLVIAVVYQIILGQLTVTLKLLPLIVTQHLLGGFTILSLLWLVYLNNKPFILSKYDKPIKYNSFYFILVFIAFMLVFFQIALGAWTSTHYASFSCPDFPFCQNDQPWMLMQWHDAFQLFSPIGINYDGGVLPESIRQTIQMAHRFGALIVTIYMIVLTGFLVPAFKNAISLLKPVFIIWALLIMQISLGIANVLFKLPLVTAVSHNLVAVLLLLSVLTLVYKLAIYQKRVQK